ncbi:MAG TPA: hypothetical protein VH518_08110 [Tepidisphaeraceae bacterium]|jgi:hypothetical protein
MFERVLDAISWRGPVNAQMLIEELGTVAPAARWQRGVIPYLIFQVSCDGGKDITAPLAAAMRIIRRPGCVLEANLSTMIFVTFPGTGSGDGVSLRDEAAKQIMKKLGRRVRLIKGMINGVTGNIGRGENCIRGTAFLGLEKLCMALFTQSYGYFNTLNIATGANGSANSDSHTGSAASAPENGDSKRAAVIDVW